MSVTIAASGEVKVSDSSQVKASVTISPSIAALTKWAKKEKIIAASTSNDSLNLDGLTAGSIVHLKGYDNVTGGAKEITVRLNGSITLPALTELLLVNSISGTITQIDVTTGATNPTRLEAMFGGT